MKTIVLAYHSIETPPKEEGAGLYCVSKEMFRQQMAVLGDTHPDNKKKNFPGWVSPEILITFDDGDITNYTHALPILKEFGLKAYFFILAGRIGTDNYMSWQQVKELRDAGMIIGSHGINHGFLTELTPGQLKYELKESKRIIEEKLHTQIDCFSVPRGFYNRKIISLTKEAGYLKVFTSYSEDNNGFKIGRISVMKNWDINKFKRIVERGFNIREKIIKKLKISLHKILGSRCYNKVRTKILGSKT